MKLPWHDVLLPRLKGFFKYYQAVGLPGAGDEMYAAENEVSEVVTLSLRTETTSMLPTEVKVIGCGGDIPSQTLY